MILSFLSEKFEVKFFLKYLRTYLSIAFRLSFCKTNSYCKHYSHRINPQVTHSQSNVTIENF